MSTAGPHPIGCVSAPHWLASEAGQSVLRDGGNAVEAAVAVAATLAVVYPHMTGIGGDGFWLIARPGHPVIAIDASGAAAAAADLALYEGQPSIPWRGPLAAITVAGTVAGWDAALAHYPGAMELARLLRDAIGHAEKGVPVTSGGAAIARDKGPELAAQPGAYADIFQPAGKPLGEGDLLRQPALARSLARLAEDGLGSFIAARLPGILPVIWRSWDHRLHRAIWPLIMPKPSRPCAPRSAARNCSTCPSPRKASHPC